MYNGKAITVHVMSEEEMIEELPFYIIAQNDELVQLLIDKGMNSKQSETTYDLLVNLPILESDFE